MTSKAELRCMLYDLQGGLCGLCDRALPGGRGDGVLADLVAKDAARKTSEDFEDPARLYLAHPACREAFQEGRDYQDKRQDLERLPPADAESARDAESKRRDAMTERYILLLMVALRLSRDDVLALAVESYVDGLPPESTAQLREVESEMQKLPRLRI